LDRECALRRAEEKFGDAWDMRSPVNEFRQGVQRIRRDRMLFTTENNFAEQYTVAGNGIQGKNVE
jgi:hypothetical protein